MEKRKQSRKNEKNKLKTSKLTRIGPNKQMRRSTLSLRKNIGNTDTHTQQLHE